jgi:hypothetical protein
VDERVLEALITISQRELFAITPDVRAHIADDARERRQQQVQAMMHDITDDVPDTATNTLSYEDRLLRFQDAREALRALWHWQEVDTATCSLENTGRDALANTPFFTDSFSLAESFLADSAPQDQRVRAPIDTTQAPLAIFFTREDIPSSSPTPLHPHLKTLLTPRAAQWTRRPAPQPT